MSGLISNTYLLINNTRTYISIDVYSNNRVDEQHICLLMSVIKRVNRRINTC